MEKENKGKEVQGAQEGNEVMPIDQLKSIITDISKRIEWKKKLLNKNKNCEPRPDEDVLRKLDSNLKKNNTFLKKLKTMTDSQKENLIKDFGALNLSKFSAEMAGILVDVKLKMTDIGCAIELCSLAHQRYADFAPSLVECWRKVLPRPPTKKDPDPPTITNPSKLRVDLRFFAELVTVGVIGEKEGLGLLAAALTQLIKDDKTDHNNLSIITTFAKFCGHDYAGLITTGVQKACKKHALQFPPSNFYSPDRKNNVRNLLVDYYKSAVDHVLTDFKHVKQIERRNRRQYQMKGEVFADNANEYERVKAEFEKFLASVKQLAEQVEQGPPPLPEDINADELVQEGGIIVQMDMAARGMDGEGGLWEDEDTRQFYETLPELKQMLPGILYKDSEQATLAPIVEELVAPEPEGGETEANEKAEEGEKVEKEEAEKEEVKEELVEEQRADENEAAEKEDEGDEQEIKVIEEEGDAVSGDTLKAMMEVFEKDLPNLVNRDLIDKAAVDFVTNLNTKINRRKLVRALYLVPRTRLDLMPFYARLIAVLNPVMPDVGTEIVHTLLGDWRRHIRKKDQVLTESKMKSARMIGELTKFGICPKSECLHCFKQVLFDFRRHNIEMACGLLDCVGYFLYHSPQSHQKTKVLLEQMMRKKQAAGAGLDSRYQMLIDNAFYVCCPPPGGAVQKIERPPMQQYIRKLLYNDLSKKEVVNIMKQFRKLDWTNEQVTNYALDGLLACWRVKYSCIRHLASLLAGLMYYHTWIGSRIVDSLLEDTRLGMEVNHTKFNQRRIACVKYLGEMYNFKVVDSTVVFSVLYSFITFGVSYDANMPSPIDPPDHLFRIRLVCTLLDTCGEYYSSGSSKVKLDCFLTYFLRYYWMKKSSTIWTEDRPFPNEVDDIVANTVSALRPKRQLYTKLEEAESDVKKIEEEYKEKVESALKFVGEDDIIEDIEEEYVLGPIQEEDDEEKTQEDSTQSTQHGSQHGRSGGASLNDDVDFGEDRVVVHDKGHATVQDGDFCSALDELMSESLQSRVHEQSRIAQAEIMVPPNLKAKLNRKARFADEADNEEEEGQEHVEEEEASTNQKITFTLMVKGRNNKPTLKNIKVSSDSSLAQTWKDRVEVEEQEKQKLKELTLNMTQRMAQEEFLEAQQEFKKAFVMAPREGQPRKFQHQKGAPFPKEMFNSWN